MMYWGDEDLLSALDGRIVIGLDVSPEEAALRFRFSDGEAVVWETEGDCCSQSWWADGLQLNSLRGAAVTAAETIDLPDYDLDDGRTRQEEDSVYGVRITTDKGVTTLAFRNSSNGYYGGWAGLGGDAEGTDWREITGNEWSA